jgi:restriction endonuclease Mrr
MIGDFDKAKKIYEKGIYITTSQNETHAREELQQALDELL